MDDNRLKGLVGIVGLALVGTIVAGAVVGSGSAADDLRPKAVKALQVAGLKAITVDFDGREAKLSGGLADERGKAISVVEDINGVRWAKFSGKPATAPVPPAAPSASSMKLSRSDVGATIGGVVPTAEAAAELKTAAAEAFGGSVSGDFRVDPSVDPAPWITALPEVFGDLAGVKNLEIGIGGGDQVQLGGSIESRAGADRVEALVAAAVPDLSVDSTITVDTGPSDPVKGKALGDSGGAAVTTYLVRAGVDSGRITTKSFGSGENTLADPFAKKYRRVDFVVGES